jgi:hypothetical protein
MNSNEPASDPWLNQVAELIETYRTLVTVRIIQHTSLGISMSIIGILTSTLALFIFLFSGLGFAWWLGEYLHNMKLGFFIMGGVYIILLITLLLISRSVLMPFIRNYIIKKIYDQD